MQKCVCDICGIGEPERHFKIKERKLIFSSGCDCKMPKCTEVDICDKCFDNLAKLRYEQDLEERVISFALEQYEKLYPDDVDMQRAYLTGIQSVIDNLLQNKIVKQR